MEKAGTENETQRRVVQLFMMVCKYVRIERHGYWLTKELLTMIQTESEFPHWNESRWHLLGET